MKSKDAMLPKDILKELAQCKGGLFFIDSIGGYAYFTGYCFRDYTDNSIVHLTDDAISTLGSSLGL